MGGGCVYQLQRVRTLINNAPCITAFALIISLAAALMALATNYGSENLSLLSSTLPSSPWAWTPSSSSSSSAMSFNQYTTTTRTQTNPRTALYPVFTSPKMQRLVVKMEKELDEVTVLRRGKERDTKVERIETGLARARRLIKDAIIQSRHDSPAAAAAADPALLPAHVEEDGSSDNYYYVPRGEIYKNPYVLQRSYELMESMFKIYVYEEGEPPLFHRGPTMDIYSTEGIFIRFIENHRFRTYDPAQAHVYFLPFSVVEILHHLFDPIVRDKAVLERVVRDYVRLISTRYPYWNTSLGADHFMLSCHDWGPRATWYVHKLYLTSIRVLCNANTSEFFNPRKDVSFPEINVRSMQNQSIAGLASPMSSNRTILAFFAGQLHGKIRRLLFRQWENRDADVKLFERIPENSSLSYDEMMERSKYCLCPSGHEVASPRIVEAIYAECVPVLISEDYVLPFSDVLDWDKFSVRVSVGELPELKRILTGIGDEEFKLLQKRVREVRRHFVVNDPPKRYDVFHMTIHSLWLRRLNLRINAA